MLRKRLLSVLLCLCMVMVPALAPTAYAAGTGVIDKINSFRSRYPHGYYWNRYGKVINEYGVTNAPCPGDHFSTHNLWENIFKYCNSYNGGYQCMGFAYKFFYELFGVQCGSSAVPRKYDRDNITVGDYVRYENNNGVGHSFIVIGRTGNKLSIVECNYATNCQIRWENRLVDLYGTNSPYDDYTFRYYYHAPQDVYEIGRAHV